MQLEKGAAAAGWLSSTRGLHHGQSGGHNKRPMWLAAQQGGGCVTVGLAAHASAVPCVRARGTPRLRSPRPCDSGQIGKSDACLIHQADTCITAHAYARLGAVIQVSAWLMRYAQNVCTHPRTPTASPPPQAMHPVEPLCRLTQSSSLRQPPFSPPGRARPTHAHLLPTHGACL